MGQHIVDEAGRIINPAKQEQLPTNLDGGKLATKADQGAKGTEGWLADVSSVTAAALATGALTRESITCTLADTNYAATAAAPAWARYVTLYALNDFVVAYGEATTATIGIRLAGGLQHTIPLSSVGASINVQSPSAGTVVRVGYQG